MKKNRYQELCEIWLERANEDRLWAKSSLKEGFYGGVCFLSQQIVEKTLKAYLFHHKEELIRTHNLVRLLKSCQKHNAEFEGYLKACKTLN